jgi:phage nucleotide-binding protein
MRYIDKIKTIPPTNADHALIIGSALHKGIELGEAAGIKFYYDSFSIITDDQINETIKLEYWIPRVRKILPAGVHEVCVYDSNFIGYIDYISANDDGSFDLWDFKYSNNIKNYLDSEQLHLYKYHYEKQYHHPIRNLNYVFIPKINIKLKKGEDLYLFRKRIVEELKKSEIQIIQIDYDPQKVIDFYSKIEIIRETKEFPKEPSYLCNWCEYQDYCEKGVDFMLLPENKRREKTIDTNPDMWIYADSYVGKSTFVDQFDDLLFINTDGNTDNTTSPVVRIADVVTVEGRMTKRKFAWEVFLETVAELEKKENNFKRVCLDLIEDLYEHCRLYKYDKLGIEHEQDAGYGKGWDMVRTEFLSAIKRLKNLGYQIIYISKEITSEITLKNGSKLSVVKPNIADKVANVLAGTVDLTVRAYMDGEERYLQLEKKENIFGGGRFNFKTNRILLDKEEFLKALQEAQEGIKTRNKETVKETVKTVTPDSSTPEAEADSFTLKVQETELKQEQTEPVRKTRKRRGE